MNWPEMPYYRSYTKLTFKMYYKILWSLAGNPLEPGAWFPLPKTQKTKKQKVQKCKFPSTSVCNSISGSATLQRVAHVREWLLLMQKISF